MKDSLRIYIPYSKVVAMMHYEPVLVKVSFSSSLDMEMLIRLKDYYLKEQTTGLIIRRKHWYERLMFWKKM